MVAKYFRGIRLSSNLEDIRLVSVRFFHRLGYLNISLTTVIPPSLPFHRLEIGSLIFLYYNDDIIFVFIRILLCCGGVDPSL